jgi:hypothetical protein
MMWGLGSGNCKWWAREDAFMDSRLQGLEDKEEGKSRNWESKIIEKGRSEDLNAILFDGDIKYGLLSG